MTVSLLDRRMADLNARFATNLERCSHLVATNAARVQLLTANPTQPRGAVRRKGG